MARCGVSAKGGWPPRVAPMLAASAAPSWFTTPALASTEIKFTALRPRSARCSGRSSAQAPAAGGGGLPTTRARARWWRVGGRRRCSGPRPGGSGLSVVVRAGGTAASTYRGSARCRGARFRMRGIRVRAVLARHDQVIAVALGRCGHGSECWDARAARRVRIGHHGPAFGVGAASVAVIGNAESVAGRRFQLARGQRARCRLVALSTR